MSDSQTVTIPAAEHAATAETRPARLLRALAQNPEPLSTPALASLLAEPGRRRRLLSAYDKALRRHEQAGHVEQSRPRAQRTRPARHHLAHHPRRPRLARRPRQRTSPRRGRRRRSTTQTEQARARPLNGTRHWTKPAQPSTFRLRGSAANAPPTSSENSAAPSTRSARSSTSAKRESARTSSGTRQARKPPRKPKPRKRLSPRQTQLLLDLHQGHHTENYPPYTHTLRTLKNRGLITYTAGSGPGSIHGYTLTTEGHAIASELGKHA